MRSIIIYRDHRAIVCWLSACALLVAAMVMFGGYTRLSGSGLSITEWKPVHGIVPPTNAASWEEEFAAYRASPQYLKINRGMTLDEFKTIFWPEYLHRLLGRLIGIVFLIPLLIFASRGSLSRRLGIRLLGIFALGGLQGVIGWLMVASGLVDDPRVSHLRLALHLALAFAIFGLLVWTILEVSSRQSAVISREVSLLETGDWRLKTHLLWFSLLCLQIILGAFVAGLHGGLIYNTWPTMNGEWLPAGMLEGDPLHNLTLIQFAHRTLAVIVVAGFLLWWHLHRAYVKNAGLNKACLSIAAVLVIQFLLGVLTLLHSVPLALAMAHQMVALALFGLATGLLYRLWASTTNRSSGKASSG